MAGKDEGERPGHALYRRRVVVLGGRGILLRRFLFLFLLLARLLPLPVALPLSAREEGREYDRAEEEAKADHKVVAHYQRAAADLNFKKTKSSQSYLKFNLLCFIIYRPHCVDQHPCPRCFPGGCNEHSAEQKFTQFVATQISSSCISLTVLRPYKREIENENNIHHGTITTAQENGNCRNPQQQ